MLILFWSAVVLLCIVALTYSILGFVALVRLHLTIRRARAIAKHLGWVTIYGHDFSNKYPTITVHEYNMRIECREHSCGPWKTVYSETYGIIDEWHPGIWINNLNAIYWSLG